MQIKWLKKKIKTLFRVKRWSLHQVCEIYKDACSWSESYIDETIRNVEVCWDEHENPIKKSNPSKDIKDDF